MEFWDLRELVEEVAEEISLDGEDLGQGPRNPKDVLGSQGQGVGDIGSVGGRRQGISSKFDIQSLF